MLDLQPDGEESGDFPHHDGGVDSNSASLRIGECERWTDLGRYDVPATIGKGQLDGVFGKSHVLRERRLRPVVADVARAILVSNGGQAVSIAAAVAPRGGAIRHDASQAREGEQGK